MQNQEELNDEKAQMGQHCEERHRYWQRWAALAIGLVGAMTGLVVLLKQ